MKLVVSIFVVLSVGELANAFLLSSVSFCSSPYTSCASRPCGAVTMRADRESDFTMMQALDRKAALKSAAVTLGTALLGVNPSSSVAAPGDFSKVRADIESLMDTDANKGPTLVRLAWHSSGTYDKISKTGGSQGGTIRFEQELADGANAGLANAVKWLEPIKNKYTDISYGDLYTLAGVTAIEKMGGPKIKWRYGRKDNEVAAVPARGRLPAADKGNPWPRPRACAMCSIAWASTTGRSWPCPRARPPAGVIRTTPLRWPVDPDPKSLRGVDLLQASQERPMEGAQEFCGVPVRGSQRSPHDAPERHRASRGRKLQEVCGHVRVRRQTILSRLRQSLLHAAGARHQGPSGGQGLTKAPQQ
ncbi:unnamed protein product [Ascophyllum nodosum]